MPVQPKPRLKIETVGDVIVVNFVDKRITDEENIRIIGEQLFSLVDDQGHKKILLNFTNVESLSSAALGKLITLNRKVKIVEGKLVLCGINPTIHEAFVICGLTSLVNIQKDREVGLRSF